MYTRRRFESTHGGSPPVQLTKKISHVELPLGTRNERILPISSLRICREQHVPDSSNHSLCLIKLFSFSNPEGNKMLDCSIHLPLLCGNQQPDGSISLSPSLSPSPSSTTTTITTTTTTTHNTLKKSKTAKQHHTQHMERKTERDRERRQRKRRERKRDAALLKLASPSSGC